MKVILSRKGFDSKNGGHPSPILPDGKMISLPIPQDGDNFSYSDLELDGYGTYLDLMKSLFKNKIKVKGKRRKLYKITKCHLDPDIRKEVLERDKRWRGIFGQSGKAQVHLKNQEVKKNDIFLFFGTFRHTKKDGSGFEGKEKHVFFGYLQVGKVIPDIPKWAEYHSHAKRINEKNNAIYIARKSLDGKPNIPGFGIFKFNGKPLEKYGLVLTKEKCSLSKWNLPSLFNDKDVKISYHSRNSWRKGYFQSAYGPNRQDFVVDDNSCVEEWAKKLIEKNIIA